MTSTLLFLSPLTIVCCKSYLIIIFCNVDTYPALPHVFAGINCASNPCSIHSDCFDHDAGYKCVCHLGYEGVNCSQRKYLCFLLYGAYLSIMPYPWGGGGDTPTTMVYIDVPRNKSLSTGYDFVLESP